MCVNMQQSGGVVLRTKTAHDVNIELNGLTLYEYNAHSAIPKEQLLLNTIHILNSRFSRKRTSVNEPQG